LIRNITTHPFSKGERILFDTNVWLYTYGPISYTRQNWAGEYSKALAKISKNRCEIFICQTIISEFINRCISDELYLKGIPFEVKKTFQRLPDFKPIAKKVGVYMEDILSFAECCDSSFNKPKANVYLKGFQECKLDYNDLVIEDICIANDLILVTNDSDFKDTVLSKFLLNFYYFYYFNPHIFNPKLLSI